MKNRRNQNQAILNIITPKPLPNKNGLMKTVYKGYKIWQSTKSVTYTTKISGHTWTETIPADTYYVVGLGVSCIRKFNSVENCKEHIDFLIRNNLNIDYSQLKGI